MPIDTSGPDATIDIEEKKDEAVIEQQEEKTEQTTIKHKLISEANYDDMALQKQALTPDLEHYANRNS